MKKTALPAEKRGAGGGGGEETMLSAFELRTDRFHVSRSFYIYLIFLISHMDRLAQWDSKVLCLNSTDGLGYFGK